jgi:hypothetical protein
VVKPIHLAIVKRDRPDVIASLRRMPAEDIQLLMDRRQADRRAATASRSPASPWTPAPPRQGFTERRRVERRRPLAATWEPLGFVIVAASTPEG